MPLLRVTRVTFAADRVEAAARVFEARSRAIADEPGCLAIAFGQQAERPRAAVAVSVWSDEPSHAAHERTASYARFAEIVARDGLLAGPPSIEVFDAPVFRCFAAD
jgi:quinol monooxygenase YgiN